MLKILSMSVKAFGENVRRIRNDKGLSLKKVEAQSSGRITGSYVNQIENGLVAVEDISLGKLIGLAKGLQISFDELMTEALGKDFGKNSFISKLDSFLIPVEGWSSEEKNLFLKYIQIFISGMNATSHITPSNFVLYPEPKFYLSNNHNLSEDVKNVLVKEFNKLVNTTISQTEIKNVVDLDNVRLYRIEDSTTEDEKEARVEGLKFGESEKQMIPVLREHAGANDHKNNE